MPETDINNAELAELTAEVVAAYVSKNPVPVASLSDLITSVHSSLSGLNGRQIHLPRRKFRPLIPRSRSFLTTSLA